MNKLFIFSICIVVVLSLIVVNVNKVENEYEEKIAKKLQETKKKNFVFFRNDDVHEMRQDLIDLTNMFIEENVSISHGVIPDWITNDTADWLLDLKFKHPDLIFITQHGWDHSAHGCGEFGECRTFEQQHRDITLGVNKMEEKFEDSFSKIFVPPKLMYTEDTLKSMKMNGFHILSAGVSRKNIAGKHAIMDISMCIDVLEDNNYYGDKVKSYENIIKEYDRCKKHHKVVGIMLHHWAINSSDLDIIKQVVNNVKNDPDIEIIALK